MKVKFFGLLPQDEDTDCCGVVKCPQCKKWSELQSQDYVIKPMIWCDNCGYRGVLNFNKIKKLKIKSKEKKDKLLKLYYRDGNYFHCSPEPEFCYKVDLYYITKICNMDLEWIENLDDKNKNSINTVLDNINLLSDYQNNFYEYSVKTKEQKEETEIKIKNFLKENHMKLSEPVKYHINEKYEKIPYDSDSKLHTYIKRYLNDDYTQEFKCWLPLNSYNANEPEIPYHENFDTFHDGNNIYLECLNENDEPFRIKYWGD
jgi:hypothetical protein